MRGKLTRATAILALIGLIGPTDVSAQGADVGNLLAGLGAIGASGPQNLLVWRANIVGGEYSGHAGFLDFPAYMGWAAAFMGEGDLDTSVPRLILTMDPMGWDNPLGAVMGGVLGGSLADLPSILSLADTSIAIFFDLPGDMREARLPLVPTDDLPPNTGMLGFVSPLGTGELHSGVAVGGELVITNVDGGLRGEFAAPVRYSPHDGPRRNVSMSGIVTGEFCEIGPEDLENAVEAGLEVEWGVVPCLHEEDEPFQVVENAPRHGQENVVTDMATLHVAFSSSVAIAEFEENFEVFTMDHRNEKMTVDGIVVSDGPDAFAFSPEGPLEQGVIYEARVTGGDDGIASHDGEKLEGDHWWRFSTIIEIDEDDLEMSFYQTIRDAPLLRDKPTLTRVMVEWEERDDIAATWQPLSFPAYVRTWNEHDGWMYPDRFDHVYRVRRPDRHSNSDRRFALDTVNLFNWRPSLTSGVVDVDLIIEHHDPYPAVAQRPMLEGDGAIAMWPHEPRNISMTYYLLPVGEWETGVPAIDASAAHRIVRNAEIFVRQTMPVTSLSSTYAGVLPRDDIHTQAAISIGGLRISESDDPLTVITETMLRLQWDVIDRGGSDILLLMTPLDWYTYGSAFLNIRSNTEWWEQEDPAAAGLRWIGSVIQAPVSPGIVNSTALPHEIGHGFGLSHSPSDAAVTWSDKTCDNPIWGLRGWSADIEGFRIAPSGEHGAHKSFTHGNAEHHWRMEPLMYPCAIEDTQAFIRGANYAQLQSTPFLRQQYSSLERDRHNRPGAAGRVDLASLVPGLMTLGAPDPAVGELTANARLRIIGRAELNGNGAAIQSIRPLGRRSTVPDGPFTAVLLDGDGRILESERFGIADAGTDPGHDHTHDHAHDHAHDPAPEAGGPATWPLFTVSIADHPDARRLEIRRDGRLLAGRDRPAVAPALRISGVSPSGRLSGPTILEWSIDGETDVGRNASYTVLFSPDGGAPWRFLAIDSGQRELALDPSMLVPGPAPTIRVIANDGFNETTQDVAITVIREPVPLLTQPGGEARWPTMLDVEAVFDVDLDRETLEGRFELVDGDGDVVPSTIRYDAASRTALLTPDDDLTPMSSFRAVVGAGVADAHGNVLSRDVAWEFQTGEAGYQSEQESFFDSLPGGPPPEPGERRGSAAGHEPPDPDVRHASLSPDMEPEGPGAALDADAEPDAALMLGMLVVDGVDYPFTVDECILEATRLGLTEIRGRGLDPETRKPIQIRAQRVDLGSALMDVVTMTTADDEFAAIHTGQVGEWRDVEGNDVDELLTWSDGEFLAQGVMHDMLRTKTQAFTYVASCP